MKIAAIRHLAEIHCADALAAAEQALLQGHSPAVQVPGAAPGEQLTHVLAAQFVQRYVQQNRCSTAEALRVFSARVRTSIS